MLQGASENCSLVAFPNHIWILIPYNSHTYFPQFIYTRFCIYLYRFSNSKAKKERLGTRDPQRPVKPRHSACNCIIFLAWCYYASYNAD